MSNGITLSASVRNNLLSLQGTAKMMSETQNRLATGNKVNSAVDNANSFFTAAGLNNRASDLSTLQDNMGLAVKTVNAASTAIDSIQKLVTQAKSVANQALQTTVVAASASSAITPTTFNASAGAKDLTIKVGDTETTISLTTDITSAGVLATALSGAVSGLTVSTSGGELKLAVASGDNVTLSGAAATDLFGGNVASTDGVSRSTYITQYNDLLDQIDELTQDAGFNGINLVAGAGDNKNLTVNFNEDQTSTLDLKAVDLTSSGLNLSDATDWSSKSAIDAVTATLDSAKSTLRSQASTFGSNLAVIQNRQDFTQNTIDNLQAGAGDLTLADINQEGANLLALQTRQSLATTALSMSNQASSSILSILR